MSAYESAMALCEVALAFGQVDRVTRHPDGRPETDTTHTVMLALVAVSLADRAGVPLNTGLVSAYAMVHDLPETFAGDVDTTGGLTAEALQAKAVCEAQAMRALQSTLQQAPTILSLLDRYNAQMEPEARWVRYIDKILPKLVNALDECAAVRARGWAAETLAQAHATQAAELFERYPEFTGAHALYHEASLRMLTIMVEQESAARPTDVR